MKPKTCQIFPFLLITSFYFLISPSPALAEEELYFLHQDHLGSTSLATDKDGEEVSRQVYYPYGSTRASQGTLPSERHYTGQVSDVPQANLYYYNARYYQPQLALFTQADSQVSLEDKYNYVSGNPLVRVDVSGNRCRGLGCPFPEIEGLKEPVDVARARIELTKEFNVLVHPTLVGENIFVGYEVLEEWPQYLKDYEHIEDVRWYFSKEQLRVFSEALTRVNRKIYEGKWIFPTIEGVRSGGASELGVWMGVIGPLTESDLFHCQSTFYHELAHVWEINYDQDFQELISLARNYGFEDVYQGKNDRALWETDYSYQITYKGAYIDWDDTAGSPIENAYAYLNWGEFFAVVISDIATNQSLAIKYRAFMPDLYDFIIEELFDTRSLIPPLPSLEEIGAR